jgi:hypothetical protein
VTIQRPTEGNDVDEANAETCDDTGENEHCRVLAGLHESAAGHAEGCADESSSFSSILVAAPAADEAAEHGAEVVYRCETNLLDAVSDFAIRADLSHINKSGCAADGSENTLVVTLKYQSNSGEEIEKDEKAFARQASSWLDALFKLLWIAVCVGCS